MRPLIQLPSGTWLDAGAIISIKATDQSKAHPQFTARLTVISRGGVGGVFADESPFPTFAEACDARDELAAKVNAARAETTPFAPAVDPIRALARVRSGYLNAASKDEIPVRWQDRIAFDYAVSEDSPVVKGTWVTVSHIVSLIIDGWSWSDVLRAHPELSEDSLRAALAYSVEAEGEAARSMLGIPTEGSTPC